MAIIKARNPLRWIRRALLALGILSFSAVALLLAAYRFGSTGQVEEAKTPTPSANIDERTIAAGQGFDYTQTSEGRPVFRIRAERSRQDREDWAYLEEVELKIYREDGETSTATSRRARVHQKTWDAELEGDVVLRGWEDLELRARALELRDGARVLVSVGAVEFDYPPDLTGRATQLRIDRGADVIQLSGGVHLRSAAGSETPVRMDCERLVYQRSEGWIRAFDDVYLKFGEQELEAQTLSLFFEDEEGESDSDVGSPPAEDAGRLRRLRARWDVRGRLAAVDGDGFGVLGGQRVEFQGQFLEVEPHREDSALQSIRLEGGGGVPASIQVVDADGLARRLTGRLLESRTVDDQLQVVDGVGNPLLLDEFLDLEEPYFLRQACAQRARARFLPDGGLERVDLRDQVELRDADLYLSGGASATLDFERGHLDIEGPAVELYNERGIITAPRFSYARDKGILHASSGVLAVLEKTAAFGSTPLARGEEPIRVESQEATWTDSPRTFAFKGGVRAWRGQNLLLADQLRGGDDGLQELAASGTVKTVWIPAGTAGRVVAAARNPSPEPIEITSQRLSYRPATPVAAARKTAVDAGAGGSTLVYSESVEVRQAGRIIRCRELSLELDDVDRSATAPGGEPRRMICRDQVHLLDPAGRREVHGDLAVYTVELRQVEIFGEPVRLSDGSESSLTGKYLLYNLDTESVELRSRRPAGGTPGS